MLLTCRSILGLYPFLKSPTGCEHEIPEEHTSTVAVAQPKDFKLNVARKCKKINKADDFTHGRRNHRDAHKRNLGFEHVYVLAPHRDAVSICIRCVSEK